MVLRVKNSANVIAGIPIYRRNEAICKRKYDPSLLARTGRKENYMTKEYDTFVDTLAQLKENEEVEIAIRDCESYEARVVKATINRDLNKLPGGDTLWVRFSRGQLHPQPWAIRIREELGGLLERQSAKGTG